MHLMATLFHWRVSALRLGRPLCLYRQRDAVHVHTDASKQTVRHTHGVNNTNHKICKHSSIMWWCFVKQASSSMTICKQRISKPLLTYFKIKNVCYYEVMPTRHNINFKIRMRGYVKYCTKVYCSGTGYYKLRLYIV